MHRGRGHNAGSTSNRRWRAVVAVCCGCGVLMAGVRAEDAGEREKGGRRQLFHRLDQAAGAGLLGTGMTTIRQYQSAFFSSDISALGRSLHQNLLIHKKWVLGLLYSLKFVIAGLVVMLQAPRRSRACWTWPLHSGYAASWSNHLYTCLSTRKIEERYSVRGLHKQ